MSEQEAKPLQTRVESGKVYLSNIPQEERQQAPTRREIAGSQLRAFRHKRESASEERRLIQIERDTREAERLREKRRAREQLQLAREASRESLERERKKHPSRFSGLLRGRKKRKRTTRRRRPTSRRPYHRGQHRTCPPCNIYRKKQRLAKRRRAIMRSANR